MQPETHIGSELSLTLFCVTQPGLAAVKVDINIYICILYISLLYMCLPSYSLSHTQSFLFYAFWWLLSNAKSLWSLCSATATINNEE